MAVFHRCRARRDGERVGGRGDDCRFVPPDPPHSALALTSEDGGECEWRWVAPGLPIPAEADRGFYPL